VSADEIDKSSSLSKKKKNPYRLDFKVFDYFCFKCQRVFTFQNISSEKYSRVPTNILIRYIINYECLKCCIQEHL